MPRVPDAVIRVVSTVGREAIHEPADPGRVVDAASVRIVAAALTGDTVDPRALDAACDALAEDPDGVERFAAMTRRATRVLVDHDSAGGDSIPIDRAVRLAAVNAAVLRALGRKHRANEVAYERFAGAALDVAAASGFEDACGRAADALAQLSGMQAAAVYVPGPEHARMVRAARDTAGSQIEPSQRNDGRRFDTPVAVRVDRGLFADVVAGERPVFVSQREPIEALPGTGARTLVAVPMRDRIGRPVGILLALDEGTHDLDVAAVESIRRLAGVVAGELASAAAMRRSTAALGTLPDLAEVAHSDDSDVTAQLEQLARIISRATDSDSAVVRVRDTAGRFLETRAVISSHGDAIADAIGTRTPLLDEHVGGGLVGSDHGRGFGSVVVPHDGSTSRAAIGRRLRDAAAEGHGDLDLDLDVDAAGARQVPRARLRTDLDPAELGLGEHELVGIDEPPRTWSQAGQRVLRELAARTVASYPIDSRYGRSAVLYVVRTTARPFDEVDRACMRIVTAHATHVIDRHVAQQQTARAIDAARSAVRLLGEALVAGVRTQRTLRFLPRLFHEMFASSGVRTWRRDRAGALTLVAGAGTIEQEGASDALLRAFERPLELDLDTRSHPHMAAVAFEGYGDQLVGIEFQLADDRSLGVEEQRLAVDVASRIQEAIYSAGHAAAQQLQLDRIRSLQEIAALAHEQLAEQHVVDTVLAHVPELYGARGSAVLLVDDSGDLQHRGSVDLPAGVIEALAGTRGWIVDAAGGDERASVLTMSRAGHDERLGPMLRTAIVAEGLADHAMVIVPLSGREQTLGLVVLSFPGELPAEFVDETSAGRDGTLAAWGRHIGSALLNARRYEREQSVRGHTEHLLETERENARQVRALHEVSRAFANSLSFEETLNAVAEAMTERLDVDAVWIRTLDERGESMELRAFHATHPELAIALERMVAPPEPRDDPITVEVLQSRRAVLISEPSDAAIAKSELLRRLSPFLQRGSTLAMLPMMRPGSAAEDVMGTLVMLSIDSEHALTYDKVDIAGSVTDQAALALDNARLYEQQKSFTEIIQESLLPRRLPDVPQIDYGVLYRSANVGGGAEIGGDFYDFLELEDGRLAMALGDVTGKGVQAAADTAMTKYVFRSLAREHPSPESFLRYANEVVCDEISSGKFVTLFYAVIDPVNHTFTCGLAGHPEPKLLYPGGTLLGDGRIVPEDEPEIISVGMEGLALGILNDQDYEQKTYHFPPGAALVVYTDGVVEARREGRLYGQFRLERRIMEESDGGAGQIAYSIYEDCHAYAEHGLNDDVAIVVVRHVPTT